MQIFPRTLRRSWLRRLAGAGIARHLLAGALAAGLGMAILGGCSRLRPRLATEYVYVTAKQTSLRDRVAAVSNRVAIVQNGDCLRVLEHGRHYIHVKTAAGVLGWISEKAVATQETYDGFVDLGKQHKADPAVAAAVVRDEVNLHLKPGRTTEIFYQLPEGAKLQLLDRATLPRSVPGGAAAAKRSVVTGTADKKVGAEGTGTDGPPPIAMEDWWLARDAQGHTGWLLSRMIDVDAPDSLTRYAEGQRIIGAYVLTRVYDPDAGDDQPDKNVPIYLTVMGPYKAGLPYDFDQVRVFTWSTKMHRYETGFRDKNIEGYLPVKIENSKDPYGKSATAQTPLPTFRYRVLAADAGPVVPDPATGMMTPGRTIEKTYRLEGNLVRRLAAPGSKDEPEAHPAPEAKKAAAGKKRR